MATKQPSVAALKKLLAEEKAHNEKLTKDLKSANDNKDYYNRQVTVAQAEVESIHSLLDILPNAIARKTVADPERAWEVVTHNVLTRLAGYLALRS